MDQPTTNIPRGTRLRGQSLRAAGVIGFCVYLAWGWSRLPNASILLGPLWLVYEFRDFTSCAIAVTLFAALISPAFKPGVVTGCLSGVAFLLWLLVGIGGEGTEC